MNLGIAHYGRFLSNFRAMSVQGVGWKGDYKYAYFHTYSNVDITIILFNHASFNSDC